jgi:hypothetical protein
LRYFTLQLQNERDYRVKSQESSPEPFSRITVHSNNRLSRKEHLCERIILYLDYKDEAAIQSLHAGFDGMNIVQFVGTSPIPGVTPRSACEFLVARLSPVFRGPVCPCSALIKRVVVAELGEHDHGAVFAAGPLAVPKSIAIYSRGIVTAIGRWGV